MASTLPTEWRETTLGQVSIKITKGTTPTTLGRDFIPVGVNFVKVESITEDGQLRPEKFAHIDEETHALLSRSVLQEDDILFSIAGAIGRSAIVKKEFLPANINQAVAVIRPNVQLVDPSFLGFFLRNESVVQFVNSIVAQSVQANINLQQLSTLGMVLPSLGEQKEITKVLSSLEKKIELLRKQNEILEHIMRTLFNEWVANKTQDEIPEGWTTEGLSGVADFLNGIALQKYPATDVTDFLPAIKIKELNTGITDATDKVSREVPEKYIVRDGDVLFSWSGSLEVVIWQHGEGALNQHLFKVSSEKYPKWFYYFWLLYHLPSFRSIAANKATTMGHIQRFHLDQAQVLVPDSQTLKEMNAAIAPTFEKLIMNNEQIKSLVILRDLLLPKLMRGEIRVTA